MYVDRTCKRQGIGNAMLYELEDYARGKGLKEIRADVSYAAEGFFKNKGYVVLKKQERKAVNMAMGNLLMMKRLVAGNGHADPNGHLMPERLGTTDCNRPQKI